MPFAGCAPNGPMTLGSHSMSIITQKTCTRCNRTFEATLENFKRQPNGKCGLSSWCSKCYDEYQAEYRDRNREKRRKQGRSYYQNNKEKIREKYLTQRQHILEYSREYYILHKDRYKELHSKWVKEHPNYRKDKYWEDPERFREKSRNNRKRNYWKVLLRNRTYKARKRAAEGEYSTQDIRIMMRMQKRKCWWCGCSIKDRYHVDHRIPLSRGGTNNPENLCLTCPSCNLKKHNKMPWEWNGRLL